MVVDHHVFPTAFLTNYLNPMMNQVEPSSLAPYAGDPDNCMHGFNNQLGPDGKMLQSCMDCQELDSQGYPLAAAYCRRLPDVGLATRAVEQVQQSVEYGAAELDNLRHDMNKIVKDHPALTPEPVVFLPPDSTTLKSIAQGSQDPPIIDPIIKQIRESVPTEEDGFAAKIHAGIAGKMPDIAKIQHAVIQARHPIGQNTDPTNYEKLLRAATEAKNVQSWVDHAKQHGDLAIMKRLVMRSFRHPAKPAMGFLKDPSRPGQFLTETGSSGHEKLLQFGATKEDILNIRRAVTRVENRNGVFVDPVDQEFDKYLNERCSMIRQVLDGKNAPEPDLTPWMPGTTEFGPGAKCVMRLYSENAGTHFIKQMDKRIPQIPVDKRAGAQDFFKYPGSSSAKAWLQGQRLQAKLNQIETQVNSKWQAVRQQLLDSEHQKWPVVTNWFGKYIHAKEGLGDHKGQVGYVMEQKRVRIPLAGPSTDNPEEESDLSLSPGAYKLRVKWQMFDGSTDETWINVDNMHKQKDLFTLYVVDKDKAGEMNMKKEDLEQWEPRQEKYEDAYFQYENEQRKLQALRAVEPLSQQLVDHKLQQFDEENRWLTMVHARKMLDHAVLHAEDAPSSTKDDADMPTILKATSSSEANPDRAAQNFLDILEKMRRSVKLPLEVARKDLGIKPGTLIPGKPYILQTNALMTKFQLGGSFTKESMHEKYLWGLLENGMKPLGLISDATLKNGGRLEDHFMSVLQKWADMRQYEYQIQDVRKTLAESLSPKTSYDLAYGREHGTSLKDHLHRELGLSASDLKLKVEDIGHVGVLAAALVPIPTPSCRQKHKHFL